jgi:hypothetical protein
MFGSPDFFQSLCFNQFSRDAPLHSEHLLAIDQRRICRGVTARATTRRCPEYIELPKSGRTYTL